MQVKKWKWFLNFLSTKKLIQVCIFFNRSEFSSFTASFFTVTKYLQFHETFDIVHNCDKSWILSIFFFTNDLSKTVQLIIYLLLYYSTNLLIFVTYVNVNIFFFIPVSRPNSTMNNSFYVLLGLSLLIGFSESLFHAECSVKW